MAETQIQDYYLFRDLKRPTGRSTQVLTAVAAYHGVPIHRIRKLLGIALSDWPRLQGALADYAHRIESAWPRPALGRELCYTQPPPARQVLLLVAAYAGIPAYRSGESVGVCVADRSRMEIALRDHDRRLRSARPRPAPLVLRRACTPGPDPAVPRA